MLLEKEQQHLDKTQNWRRKIDPLMIWISSAETKINTHFDIAPDLDTVKKQKLELEVLLTPCYFLYGNKMEKSIIKSSAQLLLSTK